MRLWRRMHHKGRKDTPIQGCGKYLWTLVFKNLLRFICKKRLLSMVTFSNWIFNKGHSLIVDYDCIVLMLLNKIIFNTITPETKKKRVLYDTMTWRPLTFDFGVFCFTVYSPLIRHSKRSRNQFTAVSLIPSDDVFVTQRLRSSK